MTRSRRITACGIVFLMTLGSRLAAQEQTDYFSVDALRAFAQSLYDEGDYSRAAGEFLRCSFLSGDDPHRREVDFLVAKCRQCSGENEAALTGFLEIASSGIDDEWHVRARYEIAITEALLGRSGESLAMLRDPMLPDLSPGRDSPLVQGWVLLLVHDWRSADEVLGRSSSSLAPELRALAREGLSLPRRDPVLAGALSALLPGAGKLYAGRPTDALFSLGFIGSLVVLSALNFSHEGIGSVRGWTYGSLALVFHAGNVYGAVVAAEEFNRGGDDLVEARARKFYEDTLR